MTVLVLVVVGVSTPWWQRSSQDTLPQEETIDDLIDKDRYFKMAGYTLATWEAHALQNTRDVFSDCY